MNLEAINSVFFVGIGGIGMSGIARYFHNSGLKVYGYDRVQSEITNDLELLGIELTYEDNEASISPDLRNLEQKSVLVVYTPAIPRENRILQFFINADYTIKKRAEVLGMIVNDGYTLAVAGTHGKTTTSCILAHILNDSDRKCNAFLGGVSINFNSNVLLDKSANYSVVEADEFDRSFLHVKPNVAVITAIDADHLDVYGDSDAFITSFISFASNIKTGGKLLLQDQLRAKLQLDGVESYLYGFTNEADFQIIDLKIIDDHYEFDFETPFGRLKGLQFFVPGEYNVENAAAAVAVAMLLNIDESDIRNALHSFLGVRRRFEHHIKNDRLVFIDDYAHHPTELNACLQAVRDFYPEKKVTGIFQPHLFSRTRDFLEEFAKALNQLDEVVLLEIYPAREKPIPGINSRKLLDIIENPHKKLIEKQQLIDEINIEELEVLLTLGAGDIDELIEPLKIKLTTQMKLSAT